MTEISRVPRVDAGEVELRLEASKIALETEIFSSIKEFVEISEKIYRFLHYGEIKEE